MPIPATTPRVMATALLAVLSLAGCSAAVPGSAASAPPAPPTVSAPGSGGSATGSPSVPAGGCQVTIGGRGNIRISGASNRAVTTNGASSFSCAGGPLVAIDEVADGAVSFTPDGGAPVRIAAGETSAVGSYRITVASAAGDAAQFVVAPG